ncbi:DUF421 domain-containing protein [Pelagibacterium lacus]|nr:YetF domain-containing protein [Pelagibacterium lacus]
MDQTIVAFDLKRMLIGDAPPLFFLEIIFRTAVIYCYSLFLIRWLGSRAIGQLTIVEFLLVIALGSAVGDAMFYPEVPLLHALLVITLVVLANKALDVIMGRSERAEDFIDGHPHTVVRDGVLDVESLAAGQLSREEIFQELRKKGIRNLAEVDRAYIERDGVVTVFRTRDGPASGLRIEPPFAIARPELVDPSTYGDAVVCANCGYHSGPGTGQCDNCGRRAWTPAQQK